MQVLHSGSIVARAAAVKTLCKTGEVRLLLSSTDSEVRRMTAETLAKMDHVSQFSLALSKLLGDDKLVRDAAIEALVHIGSEACPYVAAHLGSEHPLVREGALCTLGKFGHIALAHVSSVAEMLWDSHHNVREAAVLALQNMGEAGTRHLSASTAAMCLDTACAKHLELPLLEMVCVRIGWSFASNEGRAIAWVHGKENMLESLSGLKGGDLISHIPAMGTLLWKVPLAQALRTAGMNFGPRTWCVPEAAPQTLWSGSFLVEHFGQSVESVCTEAFSARPAIVIVKPSAGSQGKGISLAGSSQELHSAMEMLAKPDAIIQEYIDRPLLLDGYKWDARIYALVLPRLHEQPLLDREGYGSQSNHFGTEAFACFIAHEGLVRVCLDRYEPASSRNLHRSASHLTNYSLSKLSEKYIHNEDPNDASHGTKRVLTAVLQRLEDDTETGLSVDDIWQKFGTLVRQTIDAITEPLQALAFDPNFWDGNEEAAKLVRKNFSRCFQVLGFDVLLDTSGDAWLLEVNSAPSLDIYEVVPRNDMPHSIAEVNKVFCAARKGDEPRCRKSGRLCRCAALPHPHTHQQSPIDVAVKVPVVEGALKIATRARDEPFGTPEAWIHGTIYKYIPTITDEAGC
jgi:tubulin polyglutamylase TTLL6/13